MRQITLLLCFFLFSYTLYAQDDCGTPDISEEEYMEIPWYGDSTYLDNFHDSLMQAVGAGLLNLLS